MPDEVLSALDETFRRRRTSPIARPVARRNDVDNAEDAADAAGARRRGPTPIRDRWPWLETFIAIQFLWGAVLFLPNSQDWRPVVRALPYGASVALLVLYTPRVMRARFPAGTRMLVGAMFLLIVNLMHPTSQVTAGVAHCLFQLTIAAPLFWGWKAIRDGSQLRRLLFLVFILNAASAGLGILQVYDPERFMPPQFSALGLQLNEYYVDALTYEGRDGRLITRPSGLSDLPGGAAVAGAITAVLGVGFSLLARSPATAAAYLASSGIGLGVIYMTQVRSLLLASIGAIGVIVVLVARRGRMVAASGIAVAGLLLVLGSFQWATSVGGRSVANRFIELAEQGAVQTFQQNRGAFLSYTIDQLLDQYPFGAGLGRWGMMNVYFGDPSNLRSEPIWVEVQLTGWLLDGGVPMWVLYGGALLLSLLSTYRAVTRRSLPDDVRWLAILVLSLEALIVAMSFAGPVFNTQLGILFWTLASALYGALLCERTGRHPHLVP